MGKEKKLSDEITKIEKCLDEKNTILTAEEISNYLGLDKSHVYPTLDLMKSLDIVDSVRRGVTYYWLKKKTSEEQAKQMLDQRRPPPPPKMKRVPKIKKAPKMRELLKASMRKAEEKTLMEENLSNVDARAASFDGPRSLLLLGIDEEAKPPPEAETTPHLPLREAPGPRKPVRVKPYATIQHLPKGYTLLAPTQARYLRESRLRGLEGSENLATLPRLFAKDVSIRRGHYGHMLYASRSTNPWDRLYVVELDPDISQSLLLPAVEERVWANWRSFDEVNEPHGVKYRMEEYDGIIDAFIESGERLVEITVEGRPAFYVKDVLDKRINERRLMGKVEASYVGDFLYLEKTNHEEVRKA